MPRSRINTSEVEQKQRCRIALLFLGADGYATFDALYCQDGKYAPFICYLVTGSRFWGRLQCVWRGGLNGPNRPAH